MSEFLQHDPGVFANELRQRGRRRASLVGAVEGVSASDTWLEPLAGDVAALPDFAGHEALFLEVGKETGCLYAAAIHCTARGQGLGGLRHQSYASLGEVLRDGLRLSRGMTRKNALAGLWWGGAKGVIAGAPGARAADPAFRRLLYAEYGAFVSSLRGLYVSGEDAGTTPEDMAVVHGATRFAVCVPPDVGGSGNPSHSTAAGVVCAMEAALDVLGLGALAGKRIAMQGAGQVGAAMIGRLLERDVARVVVDEISGERREEVMDRFAGWPVEVRAAIPGEPGVLAEPCDVLAPNALGGVLGPKTIPHVRARLVCGSANNQLEDDARDGRALYERGVAFVPGIIANRMGVVQCANEQYGAPAPDAVVDAHLSPTAPHGIAATVRTVLERSRAEGLPPVEVADLVADEAAGERHPLWPGRGRAILETLLAERWAVRG
jgi:glutamate dehydrogenase/leucine dehydrogenase